jgi:autotransporter-associated beta strand protein
VDGSNVVFTGTPTTAGTYGNIQLTVRDASGATVTGTFSITVNPAPTLGTLSSTAWTMNHPGFSGTITVSGGTGPYGGLTASNLPPGVTASMSGGTITVSGTPTAAGTYSDATFSVTDAAGAVVGRQYTVIINAVSLGTLSFNQWTINKTGFIGTIPASTGTGAFTFSKVSGKLPPGMTDSLNGGLITFAGKPTIVGTYSFTLKLTDSLGVTATQSYTIVINPATTFVWTGQGTDSNWTTPGNWDLGAAPRPGDALIFGAGAGTGQKTANNDFPDGTKFAFLRFLDGGYTTTGNDLKLTAGISSASTAGGTDTIALNVGLTATETFNIVGTTLIDVTGTISGTNLGITKTGSGTLAYDSLVGNTYTGPTTVSGGTLRLNTGSQLVDTASIAVNAGATFDLNGQDETIAKLTLTGGTVNTESGTLMVTGTITSNAAGTAATINGNLNLAGAKPTLSVGNGTAVNDLVIAAGISAGSLTKSGPGTLVLSGANSSYAGTTRVSGGVLDLPNPAALGSGPVFALAGSTLQVDGNGLTFGSALTLGSGTGGATLKNLAGSNTWSGPITDAVTSTLNVGAGTLTISGPISGAGGLTKSGTGTLLLTNGNTYTGKTTVNGGTLGGSGAIGALLVNRGATLAPGSTTTQIFKTGNVAFSAGSTFAVTLNGTTAGTDYDQLSVTGTLNLAGATLNVTLGFTPAVGSAFTLIQNDGTDAVVGTFAGLSEGATLSLSGMTFQISYVGGSGNDVLLTRTA